MFIRLAPLLALGLALWAAAPEQSANAADTVGAAPTAQPSRCPASRPGRRQPALGIRCY